MPAATRAERTNLLGYAVILAVLVIGGALGLRNVATLAETEGAVAHTHEALGAIETLLSTLKDAEIGQRGFLLMRDEKYLAPYQRAVATVEPAQMRLRTLVSDNPDQIARIAALTPKVRRRLRELERTIDLVRQKQEPAALSLMRSDSGKVMMDDIRADLNAMSTVESALLIRRRVEAASSRRFAIASMLGSGFVGAGLIGVVALITGKRLRDQRRADDTIAEQAERFRTTLASIGDGVITTDTQGRVESMNEVAQSLTRWALADARSKPLSEIFRIVNEDTRQTVASPVDRALSEGVVVGLANHTILIARDGTECFIDDSAAPIRDRDGDVTGCVLVFRDVGQQKKEERAATDALRLGDLRYRTALQAVNSLIWTNDASGRMEGEQPWWAAFTGQNFDEYQGYGWAGAVHPDDAQPTIIAWNAAVALRSMFVFEHRVRRRDGEWRTCTVRAIPVIQADDTVYEWVGVHTDVTDERATAERERRLIADASIADAKFRALFDQGAYLTAIMEPDGTVVEPNRRSWEAAGVSRDDIVGKKFWDGPWWSASDEVQEQVRLASLEAAAGNVVRCEVPFQASDGSQRIVDMIIVPIRNEQGHVTYLAPSGIDITDRVEAQKQLRESVVAIQRLASIVASSSDAIIGTDLEGVVSNWNRSATQIFGFSESEMVGQPIAVLMPPELGSGEREIMQKVLRGENVAAYDTARLGKSGARVPLSITISPIVSTHGECIGASTIARDITERKQVEEKLRRSEEDLRRIASALSEADHRKDEFLATLAHELRNPLAPIRNGLQIMRIAVNDPGAMEKSQAMIERQIEHLVRLVDDLMDISRISRGTIVLRQEKLELASVLRHAVETSRPLIDEKRQILAFEPPTTPIPVRGDRTRLTQVFANLLNNAARYTDSGGEIALAATVIDDVVEVSVRDSGIGIPPEMLTAVFEMFAQVDRSLERSQSGLGIGLTLVKRLVEMHGGRVEARSDGVGTGSEFIVRIPLSDHTHEIVQAPTPSVTTTTNRRRILVVDDNIDSAQSLGNLLSMMGHEVRLAHDGLESLSAAEAFRPDVVMLDIGMPRLNGYEACRAIRARPWAAKVRIIALTGWGQPDDRQRSLEAGFDVHLVKPVDPDALNSIMETAMRS